MKLIDLLEKEEQKGTYAGVRFSKETIDDIKKYIEENEIPNRIKFDKLHTTLLYSRKHCPNYEPAGELEEVMHGKPEKFERGYFQELHRVFFCALPLVCAFHEVFGNFAVHFSKSSAFSVSGCFL